MSNDVKNFLVVRNGTLTPEEVEEQIYGHGVSEDSYYKARLEQSGRISFWTKDAPPVQALVTIADEKRLHIALEFRSLDSSFVGSLEFRPTSDSEILEVDREPEPGK
jgi:hypothetical protein